MELPTGVLGVALGTILLPTLSKHAASQDTEQFSGLLDWGLRLCMLLTLPAAVGLAVLSFPLVTTLFMYREFTLHDAQMTQHALIAYSFGLIGLIMIKVLAPGFYARQNIKTPVKVAIFTLICTQFDEPCLHFAAQTRRSVPRYRFGRVFECRFAVFPLRKHGIYRPGKGLGCIFGQNWAISLVVMGGGLWLAQYICRLNGCTSAALKKQDNFAS